MSIGQSLQIAAQAATAMFAAAKGTEGTVDMPLGRLDERGILRADMANLPATGPANWAHAGNWRLGFYLALVCRDARSLDVLPLRRSRRRRAACAWHSHGARSLLWIETLQWL